MSDSKISDLSTSTALTGTEEVAIVQSGDTVKTTAQDIADLSTGGGSLASADQAINVSGERKITLGGSTATDFLNIENFSGTDIVQFRGDTAINIPSAGIGMGGYLPATNKKFNIYQNLTNGIGTYIEQRGTGQKGFWHLNGANVSGVGYASQQITAGGTGSRTGIELNIANGAANYAIDIKAGDIKTTGGTGLSGTYTFGGGSSGDIASMTFTVGILTATTTVP